MAMDDPRQRILVLQQQGSGEAKIRGIMVHGRGRFDLRIVSIDASLPPILDDTAGYLPDLRHADLVLDFLRHPDLSHDLMEACMACGIPVVASGRRRAQEGIHTPPT